MKTKLLLLSVLLILAVMGFVIRNIKVSAPADVNKTTNTPLPAPQNNSWLDKFYIGSVDEEIDYQNNYNELDQLGFNLWHIYSNHDNSQISGKYTPYINWYTNPNLTNDKLLTPVGSYAANLNNKIANIYSHAGRKLIIMRPKIEWLCYGQRSDYKCTDIIETQAEQELWFYHFQPQGHTTGQNVTDHSSFGNGVKVRYCQANIDNNGLVVSRLKANTEQCRRINPGDGNEWIGDSQCDWLIKPRIRGDQSFISNPANQDVIICSVDIYNQEGYDSNNPALNRISHTDIKAKYFQKNYDPINLYQGYYLEEFYFVQNQEPSAITIPNQDWGNLWSYSARGNHSPDNDNDNHADIQVYWYGNCDMWIDYIRVDNDVADKLFKGYYDDPNFPGNQWIKNEVEQIGTHQVNGEYPILKYYLEVAEFNNLPCMAYVNSKLKYYSQLYSGGAVTIDLMQDLTNVISSHVPWENRTTIENASFLNNQYIQKVGFTQVFAESYPLTACHTTNQQEQYFSKIPNTLTNNVANKVLAQETSPVQYDTWLQDNINHKPSLLEGGTCDARCDNDNPCKGGAVLRQDAGNFRNRMQLCDEISKLADIPFIFEPQLHQWYRPGEVRREPTNEELNMMANVAVSYGAKGFFALSPL